MKIIDQIGVFIKSVSGIITLSSLLISGISSWLLIHNANVKTKFAIDYVKQNKTITVHAVDSIVKLNTIPIITQIRTQHYNDSIEAFKDRYEMTVVKSSLTGYWKAKNEFQSVIDFQQKLLNAMDSLKKNN